MEEQNFDTPMNSVEDSEEEKTVSTKKSDEKVSLSREVSKIRFYLRVGSWVFTCVAVFCLIFNVIAFGVSSYQNWYRPGSFYGASSMEHFGYVWIMFASLGGGFIRCVYLFAGILVLESFRTMIGLLDRLSAER